TSGEELIIGKLCKNLAQVDTRLKRFDEADRNFRRALQLFETHLGPGHQLTGETLVGYAALCRATKRKADAKEYERRARECLGPGRNGAMGSTVDLSDLLSRRR